MTDIATAQTRRSDENTLDYSPWTFWAEATPEAKRRQLERQAGLIQDRGYTLGTDCFISELASVQNEDLTLGDRTYVAAGAYLSNSLVAGRDCTINPYAIIRGRIRLGDAVRIGAHSSILAFNHTMADPDVEVFRQPVTFKGVTVGDDVWIGSHVVVLDGVTVGSRSVIAAGAVVTKDVPAGAVVGGNPARVLRWRVPELEPQPARGAALAAFASTVREQGHDVLARFWDDEAQLFADRPRLAPTVRAQSDAIELAQLLLGTAPPQLPVEHQIAWLRERQDPRTGLVDTLTPSDQPGYTLFGVSADAAYHVLSVGHALDLLGSSFAHPIRPVAEAGADELLRNLRAQPWAEDPWASGAWIDAVGTAVRWNCTFPGVQDPSTLEALLGWMLSNADPQTGMWGRPSAEFGLLRPVNGFYRATRGTFAQFGVPVPYPERVIDTVLRHIDDARYFTPSRQTACNVLDVAHPLWLTKGTGYRGAEVSAVAARLLGDAIGHWIDGAGFGFHAPGSGVTDGSDLPGLQGTEMWLAIVWLLADILEQSDALGYRPRGVHRPGPALILGEQ